MLLGYHFTTTCLEPRHSTFTMRQLLPLILLALLFPTLLAADSAVGEWLRDDKSSRIKVSVSGGKLSGVITYVKDPARTLDTRNPDPAKRKRKLVGLTILSGFTQKGEMWEGGTIYDSSNGKTYKGKVWLQNGQLMMRGYVGVTLIGRTAKWTRYK